MLRARQLQKLFCPKFYLATDAHGFSLIFCNESVGTKDPMHDFRFHLPRCFYVFAFHILRSAILGVLLLPLSHTFAQKPWQLDYRVQAGLENDSNIYESSVAPVSTPVGRLLLQSKAERSSKNVRLLFDYSGALLLYRAHNDEHKLLNDLKGGVTLRANDWLRFFVQGEVTLKNYLNNTADYGTSGGMLSATAGLSERAALEAGVENGQLDYAASDSLFDYTFWGAFLSLRHRLAQSAVLELTAQRRRLDYLRFAYLHFNSSLVQRAPYAQQESFSALRLAFTMSRKWLLRASLEAQFNRSNSLGYDYDRLRLQALTAWSPARRWLIRAAAMVQTKSYAESTPPIVPPEFDAEREQSNNLIVDVSRDLSGELTLLTRISYHDNESPIRGVFYRKTVFFTGMELRF